MSDLKSDAERIEGSNPSLRTKLCVTTQAVKGTVCKTVIHEFESRVTLQISPCWSMG